MEREYENIGNKLKKKADSDGKIVSVRIDSLYGLLQSLARFFYQKHHEWVALAFVEEGFSTKKIWFNKGSDHTNVQYGLDPKEVLKYSRRFNAKQIIDAHNHPLSSKDRPDYGSRRANIAASYRQKEAKFGFSDTDNMSTANYSAFLEDHDIKHADVVYVAGDYEIRGDEDMVNRFTQERNNQNRKSTSSQNRSRDSNKDLSNSGNNDNEDCFIVTLCYGRGSPEYRRMIELRDGFLSDYLIGRIAIKFYYAVSPWLVKLIRRSEILTKVSKSIAKRILLKLEALRDSRK